MRCILPVSSRPAHVSTAVCYAQLTLSQDGRFGFLTAHFFTYLNDYDDIVISTPRLIVVDIHSAKAEVRLPHKPQPNPPVLGLQTYKPTVQVCMCMAAACLTVLGRQLQKSARWMFALPGRSASAHSPVHNS